MVVERELCEKVISVSERAAPESIRQISAYCNSLTSNYIYSMSSIHPDQKYITALLEHDRVMLDELYARFSPKIRSFVLQHQGSVADAADLFQEALTDIYRKAKSGFVLSCPLDAFLFLICRNRWLSHLGRKKYNSVTFSEEEGYSNLVSEDSFAVAEEIFLSQHRKALINQKLEELGAGCRDLLKKNWAGHKLEELATLLQTTYNYIRKKKSECMQKLLELIKASPEYKLLLN